MKRLSILKTVSFLKKGYVVAVPTDTVFGLAVNAYDANAYYKLYDIKNRDYGKAIALLISDFTMLKALVDEISPIAKILLDEFWPGPLTLVLKSKKDLPEHLIGESGFMGCRVPNHQALRKVISMVNSPLAVTSANISGQSDAVSYKQLCAYFSACNDLKGVMSDKSTFSHIKKTFDGFSPTTYSATNIPSSVIKIDGDKVELLREGALSSTLLSDFLNKHTTISKLFRVGF